MNIILLDSTLKRLLAKLDEIEEDEEETKDEDNRFFSFKRFLHHKNIYRKFP